MNKYFLSFLAGCLIISLCFLSGCSKETKCYTCEGYQGTLFMKHTNVCGGQMRDYYEKQGYTCYEE